MATHDSHDALGNYRTIAVRNNYPGGRRDMSRPVESSVIVITCLQIGIAATGQNKSDMSYPQSIEPGRQHHTVRTVLNFLPLTQIQTRIT